MSIQLGQLGGGPSGLTPKVRHMSGPSGGLVTFSAKCMRSSYNSSEVKQGKMSQFSVHTGIRVTK